MDRTIASIAAGKVLSDNYAIVKPAFKFQFEGVKHQLAKEDWQEITFMAIFLTVSIFIDAARMSQMQDEDINALIQHFMECEVDHLDDLIMLNQRINEYTPLFKPLSPTPFAALSSEFLDHLSIEYDGGMIHFMMWTNALYSNVIEDMVRALSPATPKGKAVKSGGSGCLTLILTALGLCVLLCII